MKIVKEKGEKKMALTKEQKMHLKEMLLNMKKYKTERLEETPKEDLQESTGELTNGVDNHLANIATEQYERERDETIREVDERLIQQVDEALQRMEDETYGICVDTGEEIPYERLKANPYAKRTAKAQERFEKGQPSPNADRATQPSRRIDEEKTLTVDSLKKDQDAF